jgi:hypothetical protein
VSERDASIWYDGATRERREAVERIERDALAFLAEALRAFEADDSAWLHLLDDLQVPSDLDEVDDATFARGYSVRVGTDRLVLRLSERLPRQLEATHAALTRQPWCVDSQLHKGAIDLQVRALDRGVALRIEARLLSQARAVADGMKRSVAKLVAIAAPDPLPRVTAALDDATRRVDAIEAAKLDRLRASRFGLP